MMVSHTAFIGELTMKIEYLRDDFHNGYRVRHSDWPSDRFDIVGPAKLAEIKDACACLGIPIVDITNEEDEDFYTTPRRR
jgi:hypothetical protein